MRRGWRRGWLRQQPAKRAKQDLTKNRPNWVKGSVSEAVRRSDRDQHRSPYGNLKWRGSGHYRGAYNAWHSGAAAPTAQTAAVPEGGARPEDEEPTAGAGMEAGPSEAVTAHGSE